MKINLRRLLYPLLFIATGLFHGAGQGASTVDDFSLRIADALYMAFGPQAHTFNLLLHEKSPFILYAKGNARHKAQCDASATFEIAANANALGVINVGICEYGKFIDRNGAIGQRLFLEEYARGLVEGMGPSKDQASLKEVMKFEVLNLEDSSVMYYYKVIVVGHGVIFLPTAIVFPKDNSKVLIVQFRDYPLCENVKELKICREPKAGLQRLASLLIGSSQSSLSAKEMIRQAGILLTVGHYEKCIEIVSVALAVDTGNALGYQIRGRCRQMVGQHPAGLADLEKAVALSPKSAGATRALAWFYATVSEVSLQNGRKALALSEEAIRLQQDNKRKISPIYWRTLAATYARLGNFPTAVNYQEQAVVEFRRELTSMAPPTREHLAAMGWTTKRLNQELAAFDAELEIYKKNRAYTE